MTQFKRAGNALVSRSFRAETSTALKASASLTRGTHQDSKRANTGTVPLGTADTQLPTTTTPRAMADSKPESAAHIPTVQAAKTSQWSKFIKALFFELLMLFCNIVLSIFFREVRERNAFNVPRKGATILVVAPHANQFVDGAVVMSRIKNLTRRNSRPIIAESSYNDNIIGVFARLADSIPVARPQDSLKFADGELYCKGDDYKTIYGRGTKFTQFTAKGLIGLPESGGNVDIAEIINDTELVLRKPVKTPKGQKILQEGTRFKYAPKVSYDETFQHVFDALHNQGLITIFPEGGSHDRPDLLPIKAGFAIMALGAVAADPSCTVTIVPTGLNYFHRNKFRSRAVVEYGTPIKVTAEDGQRYKENPREAVAKLLDEVTTALKSVTVTAPDFETLQVIQAARRLYTKKIPLSLIVEINRKLVIGYTHYKNDPRIIHIKDAVLKYNKDLDRLGLKDHQVERTTRNRFQSFTVLIVRIIKLTFLLTLALPGTLLFAPIFIVTSKYSKMKQKAALAKSNVKIKAVDILATWKILMATLFAPSLYVTYSALGVWLTKSYNLFGGAVYHPILLFLAIYLVLVLTTYSAFKTGESGMDIVKSLPPLFNSVFGNEKELKQVKLTRERLALEITQLINDLGPTVFPDFDKATRDYVRKTRRMSMSDLVDEAERKEFKRGGKDDVLTETETEYETDKEPVFRSRSTSVSSGTSNALSRVNSEGNLSDIPILGEGGYGYYTMGNNDGETDYIRMESPAPDPKNNHASLKLRKALREKFDAEKEKEKELNE